MKTNSTLPAALGALLMMGAFVPPASAVQDEDLKFETTEDLYQVCLLYTSDAADDLQPV